MGGGAALFLAGGWGDGWDFFFPFLFLEKGRESKSPPEQGKGNLPSMSWQKAHSHIRANHPKTSSLPSALPQRTDSSFLPKLTFQSPYYPQISPSSSITPCLFSYAPLGSCSSQNEVPPHHHHSYKSLELVRLSQQPSLLPHTPTDPRASAPHSQQQKFTPRHIPHHKKEQRGPPPSKIPYSSVNYQPASSTPDSGGPAPMWLYVHFLSSWSKNHLQNYALRRRWQRG